MSLTCLAAWLVALIVLPVLVLLWATETKPQRAKRLRSYGWSQQRIAEQLNCSRSTVRRLLVA